MIFFTKIENSFPKFKWKHKRPSTGKAMVEVPQYQTSNCTTEHTKNKQKAAWDRYKNRHLGQ
jgi:hypothetical protein